MKQKPVQLAMRALVYTVGLVILAFGIALAVQSNLGASPVSSFPYVVSQIVNLSQGTCNTIVYVVYILLQMLLNGRKFQPALMLQLVFSTIFGYCIDGAKFILRDFMLPTYLGQVVMLAVSTVLISLGLTLYVEMQLGNMPPEGLVDCIAAKLGKSFATCKTLLDCISVTLGTVLSFVCLGRLVGIREGTVVAALLVGRLSGVFRRWLSPVLRRLCFGQQ